MPTGLILLALVPVIAGAARMSELAGGAEVTPDNARFLASPVPIVVHVVSVTVYSILGAFQFASGFRRRRPGWHRAAGRVLVPCGLGTALSGLWMTLFYARPADVGSAVTGLRLVVGSAMLAAIVLAFTAIRRREIARHRAWMIRAYALALGAGTQAFTQMPWILAVGPLDKSSKAALMGLGWAINIAVAEWIIRRPSRLRDARTRARHDRPASVPASSG
ncbi:DUF2306 domain-containing protein [Actinomadura sp. DC4]|uniref:DUF2306 domain-containing protein n=1 Tax=Actinomadura sp. DC4 TaxID=3055069 RepID=UPI0025B04040|nr:DUF2306 domain-containing protein [Actinomadura sp. DC4]MDN3354792.1 DUF2306 domain-containing protein [Actinomadura sp. DC4]